MIIKDNKDEEDKQWNLEVETFLNPDTLPGIPDFYKFLITGLFRSPNYCQKAWSCQKRLLLK